MLSLLSPYTMSPAALTTMAVAVLIGAAVIGWIVDEVLDDRAFGVLVNTVLVAIGIVIGLYVFDYLMTTHRLSIRYANPYGWLVAGMGGATFTLLLFCGLRAAIGR
ncbi:hypothetical protein [Methyloraptor flagellatus]|uniref:Uncharacterized protein n=1 Tax=Methyloraptor flagellatus TaxID=3162530 RepID=A0AAU7XCM5_9HYPH